MARPRFICLILALGTLLLYLPVWNYGFLVYDDQLYVTENWRVQAGLTGENIKWSFTTLHASNWHPLTWLSHMLDCQLFGLNPGAHHGINVLLHCANVVLLFLSLWKMTRALWPAAFVAAAFAWHPLHVESVAWIAERKDLLCALFGLLSLYAYARYATGGNNRKWHYALALVCFALGLMAKPMLVTWPFVLLLLDYWPLHRVRLSEPGWPRVFLRLTLEKWPFFLLTALSCAVTFLAQREEAIMDLAHRPLEARIANAIIAYATYLAKTVWPRDLAILYPLPDHLSDLTLAISAAVLIAISVLAWRTRISRPYIMIGWLWFLGTLVPVIGLVQVGRQALADRYTYLPLIGVFIATAYGARHFALRFGTKSLLVPIAILAAFNLATRHQLTLWKDSSTLFAHTVAVTRDNAVARINLGVAFEQNGRTNEALAQYQEATRIDPNRPAAHNNIANLLSARGQRDQALIHYEKALALQPTAPLAHLNLATLLIEMGRHEDAMRHYAEAARLAPNDPRPPYMMARAFLKRNQSAQAIVQLREALRRNSADIDALVMLARILASDESPANRNGTEAVRLAERANELAGGQQPFVLDALAMAYAEAGRFEEAQRVAQRAVEILQQAGAQDAVAELRQRLTLYQARQPYRETHRQNP
jgi:protein O-mannosyl-transferase